MKESVHEKTIGINRLLKVVVQAAQCKKRFSVNRVFFRIQVASFSEQNEAFEGLNKNLSIT